ncbi:PD-(D/E)XK nuclease family protein [Clostridium sp. SYSU_GA19001]|uniref:PD-(D/E)XK nuclease family protein n=1 Tax=Clostridium caldaquaticum TaxID=2940653 RepID=UPI00207742A7|nr:PD-(D/E)XK nuclease family protein [Clostridium caldaquaticum]MCM8709441.1 PD-(D/E)XK nuclease family protein [Clostridium caldaquaticum]
MDTSMFSFIKSYIPSKNKDPKEDYLTQLLAWMLLNIEGLSYEYCRFLLGKSQNKFFEINGDEIINIRTQVTVENGRIDLVINVNENGFICEHKVFSSLSNNQIEKYKNNSSTLGSGKFYTVLITATRLQHTQDADIKLTWGDICEFLELNTYKFGNLEEFLIKQLVAYLKEQGLGYSEPIKMEDILAYFPAMTLEKNLDALFYELESKDWENECPSLKNINPKDFSKKYNKYRWGRKGIDFFTPWNPGIFAGVLLDTDDHQIKPTDVNKGPDFVVLVETDYYPNKKEVMEKRNRVLNSQEFQQLKKRLQMNHGEFQLMTEVPNNPWRILVLKKPLFDIFKGKNTKEEQVQALFDNIINAVNLIAQDDLLHKAFL